MSALLICLLAAGDPIPSGQMQDKTPGSRSWVVPQDVDFISGVVVGGGGDNSGSGGGLHWRNDIPVIPGETLTIQIGTSDRFSGMSIESFVKRGSTYLLRADHGSHYSTLGGGGGNGGGGYGAGSASGGGGGAGGYMGNGGNGGNPPSGPQANSGGGAGGGPNSDGQGVGLQGRRPDFGPGSLPSAECGGGLGEGQVAGVGGVRLMWGAGRSYPDNAVDV